MSAPAAGWYDRWSTGYDAQRRQLIPPFDAFYGTAVEVATLGRRGPVRVLDLGAGTGLLAAAVADALPEAELVLLDEAPGMLDQARERLAGLGARARFVVASMEDEWPAGNYDVIVSSLAIHHLDDAGKRALFARAHARLRPSGVFVNAEQVAGPTAATDALNVARWGAQIAAAGITPAQRADADARMALDRPASVEDQVRWLREAGFAEADCVFKQWRFAVYAGWRDAVALEAAA
ncbi:class I SAM-dependent methyltransferase [Patulibacter defluvii]|uniref:class I SAM-dependent methyltransferase n=1 Tax=Patulibacter defluvii TaxID=3095358 RepID=UPI002A757AFD|nr:methyltransferase domain-containing protein [Patulibacter sp. DM4]